MWLLSLAACSPLLLLSLFSPSASRLSYSFSAAKVKCRLLPARSEEYPSGSEGAPGHLASPLLHLTFCQQYFWLSAPLHRTAHRPAAAATVAGRFCAGMCLSSVVSAFPFKFPAPPSRSVFNAARRVGPRVPAGRQPASLQCVYGEEQR